MTKTEAHDYKIIEGVLTLFDENNNKITGATNFGGYLDLSGTAITALPDGLTVGGYLDLSGTAITALPDGLTVGGSLDLSGTAITALPDGLTVGGYLYLSGTALENKQHSVKKPSDDFLNFALKKKGQIVIDGIYAVVVQERSGVLRIRNFGSKEILFAVNDGQGNWAHGKTIEEARNDLVYKITSAFEGDIPSSAKVSEWIPIYRGITGACAAGVKHFIQSKGFDLEMTMTADQVSKAVDGAYGAETFKSKLKESK